MSATADDRQAVDQLKQAHRATWASGAYADVAIHIAETLPSHLLANLGSVAGERLLDVAAGTGNLALRAAAEGATVTALDLVPELLDVGRVRAAALGCEVDWVEGDAEALPFEDAAFDAVTSVVGVQFAPRHAVVAGELARVCRPGGRVGLVNWTPEGLIGQLFEILGRYMPPAPAFASPPPLWGDEQHIRDLFADTAASISIERGTNAFRFPSVEEYATFFEERYGPTLRTKALLKEQGRWDECAAEIDALYRRLNQATDGTLHIEAEYLVAVVERA